MTLSENLVRHLYVVKGEALKKNASLAPYDKNAIATTLTAEGDIALCKTVDGEALYFNHLGKGGITRTDLIPLKNILYAKATAEADMEKPLKTATIALASDIDGDGNADTNVPRGSYVVRITIHNYIGMSDEDTYYKYGTVTSNGSLSKANFYAALKTSLEKNLSREVVDMFTISGGSTNVVITEKEQPWRLGTMQRTPVLFDVDLVPNDTDFEITKSGAVTTFDWGTVTIGKAATNLKNSKDIADAEFFCMGERADMYRGIGWPNNIDTKYMVDAESANGYDTLDIHFSYVGANEGCQASEKTITLVGEHGNSGVNAVLDDIVDELTTLGITVSKKANWA